MLPDACPTPDSSVERVYEQLKDMAIRYAFHPGERLNEGTLAKSLNVSRTPLREALNRLKMEGFLSFLPGRGFFCRELNAREVFNLYEMRKIIEIASVRLAVGRARAEDIRALLAFLDATGPDSGEYSTTQLVEFDEHFHERLVAMSGNDEMLNVLRNVNARIRFMRWIDMNRGRRVVTQNEHRQILEALRLHDEATCVAVMERHVDRRMDHIVSTIKESYAMIYMKESGSSMDEFGKDHTTTTRPGLA